MASYRDITWSDDMTMDVDTLNQMTANDRYLFDNLARMSYTAYGQAKSTGIKIASGIIVIAPSQNRGVSSSVYFGNYFSQACQPVVTVGHAGNEGVDVRIAGLSGYAPDNRGFAVHLRAHPWVNNTNNFTVTNFVHWIAMGW